MPNDAYEHMKMLLNVNKNAKIVIESVCKFHVVLNVHRIVLKSVPRVPHVQHDFVSPFDQLNSFKN